MEGKVPHPQEGDWGSARGHGLLPPGRSGGDSTVTQGAERLVTGVLFQSKSQKAMECFQRLMTSPGVVAFGEVGLDCTVSSSDWESRQQILIHLLLNLQMEISDKPTVLPYWEVSP